MQIYFLVNHREVAVAQTLGHTHRDSTPSSTSYQLCDPRHITNPLSTPGFLIYKTKKGIVPTSQDRLRKKRVSRREVYWHVLSSPDRLAEITTIETTATAAISSPLPTYYSGYTWLYSSFNQVRVTTQIFLSTGSHKQKYPDNKNDEHQP